MDALLTLVRGGGPAFQRAAASTSQGQRQVMPADEVRRLNLARLNDPSVPRAERFETLRELSVSSCSNVRDMMFGPRDEVTEAIAKARASLVKFPSDAALLELIDRWPQSFQRREGQPMANVFVSAATVSGVVLRNPRLATCTRLFTGF